MSRAPHGSPPSDEIDDDAATFYRHVLETLNGAGVPYLVGGAFAFSRFTGIHRNTKDLDLFIARSDYEAVAGALQGAGYTTELTYPHWLAKVHCGEAFVDLIFNSGNGVSPVDETWFQHACEAETLGLPVRLVAPEESLWTKAFIMERERHDGADVAHLLRACAAQLDWPRLLRRFGPHWRVLMAHLVLFGFIYPGERALVPAWVLDELMALLRQEQAAPPSPTRLCAGTLLSREQYLPDVEQGGYRDARMTSASTMAQQDVSDWTDAIPSRSP